MLDSFKHITTFVFDVDGVLTNGTLILLPNGVMARSMNIKDGYALQLAIKKGYRVLVISGGDSPEVVERLNKLGVSEVWMKVKDKKSLLDKYLKEHAIDNKAVLYMGDDIPDLSVMQSAGLACCPADAVQEIKDLSIYISHLSGGVGCVRDVIEKVLKLRGDWNDDTNIQAK